MNPTICNTHLKRGLVLEDILEANAWMTHMLQEIFPALEIVQTYNLAQTYESMQHQPAYDIALIDLGLPDGKGTELIQYMTQHSPDTLMLVVSIFEDDEYLFQAIHSGAHGYLLKDSEPELFKRALSQMAEGNFVLSPVFVQKMFNYVRQHEIQHQSKKIYHELPLTCREKEVLACIATGLQVNETAQQLHISAHTVSSYIKEIYRKLDICTRAEAALIAVRHGLI